MLTLQYITTGALVLLIVFFAYYIIRKKDVAVTLKTNIIFVTLFLILICILCVINLLHSTGVDSNNIRTVVTSITMGIALITFFTSNWFSSKNAQSTKDNQSSNFVMTLISNNYKIMESKQTKIDELINELQKKLLKNGYYFDELVSAFIEYIKKNHHVLILIGKVADGCKGDTKRQLNQLTTAYEAEQAARLLLTYLKDKELYNSFYKVIDEKERVKSFPDTGNLIESTGLQGVMDSFMQAHLDDITKKEINYDIIFDVCNTTFEKYYHELGHFLRNSYRVVKFINEQYKDDLERKKVFLGILRSQYSENTILAIYYNSAFTEKGLGYGKELICLDFFGTEDDLKGHQPIHFRQDNLLNKKTDIKLMLNVFCSTSLSTEINKNEFKETLKKIYM